MAEWVIENLTVALGGRAVVRDASLSVRAGELVALVGANGAGKSTLARAGLGLIARASGTITLNGADPSSLKPAVRARQVAWLPQARPLAWPLSVGDVVALGRFAFGATVGSLAASDRAAVDRALTECGLSGLQRRRTDTLSGGELARVHVARALAAQAPLLVADEPTAALDPAQALSVMQVIGDYCAQGGAGLVIVHDLALAARFASRVVVMQQGAILADGPPAQALSPAVLKQAFCLDAAITLLDGVPVLAVKGLG
jgi:iron complex transport system ATP-binding protein